MQVFLETLHALILEKKKLADNGNSRTAEHCKGCK